MRTILGVGTAPTAFVGSTARGLDNWPTRILGPADVERAFGGLASDSALSYGVPQYFLSGARTPSSPACRRPPPWRPRRS